MLQYSVPLHIPNILNNIVHLHLVAHCYYTFTFFFRLCAACQCLKHFIVFSTLVTFQNLQNHYMFRPELAILRC
jgi:hypothetical protein